MDITVLKAVDLNDGSDRVQVQFLGPDGTPREAWGWRSAVTNHYPKESYNPNGHRKPETAPREMSSVELLEYLTSVAVESLPVKPEPEVGEPVVLYEAATKVVAASTTAGSGPVPSKTIRK